MGSVADVQPLTDIDPLAVRVSISLSRAGGWITTPLPMTQSIPGRRIPVGTSESL